MSKFKAILAGIIFVVAALGVALFYLVVPKSIMSDEDKANAKKLSDRLKTTKKNVDDFIGNHPRRERV